jgi:uncharacterized protein (DUF305 family)
MKTLATAAASRASSEHEHAAEHGVGESLSALSPFVREMDAGMKKMMDEMHAPGYSGNPDVDFLAMMIPHHRGAIEMARLLLIHGNDPLTRQLAEEILASQTAEVIAMSERLKVLRSGQQADSGGFPALHGTRGAAPK